MSSASDNFNRADSNTTLGGNWTAAVGTWGIFSNEAYQPGGASFASAYYSAVTWGGDHFSQATAGAFYSATVTSPAVRIQASGDCYYMNAGIVFKHVSGVDTQVFNSGATFASGDVIKLDATGTTITLFKNGVSVGNGTDNSLSGGSPGMYSASASVTLNDWSASDGGAAATTVHQSTMTTMGMGG